MKKQLRFFLRIVLCAVIAAAVFFPLLRSFCLGTLRIGESDQAVLTETLGDARWEICAQDGIITLEQIQRRQGLFIPFSECVWRAEYDAAAGELISATSVSWDAERLEQEGAPLFYASRYAQLPQYGDCRFVFGIADTESFLRGGSHWQEQVVEIGDGLYAFCYYQT